MRSESLCGFRTALMLCAVVGTEFTCSLAAQSPESQQKIADVKEAVAKNKQAVAQYTWVEQDTISLKGEQKKQEHFQVRLGPDGKPQKTSLDAPAAASQPSGGRLKHHVVEKKKEEYKDYADQIKALIQQYLPPDKDLLEQAHQKGNIMVGAQPGGSGQYRVVISNYVKQGDKMTLVIDGTQKNIVSLSIASYLNDPKDAVTADAQFSPIPGGPNHVSSETINGVSKQLTIAVQNSNYQKL
ncbi:MAG: hypothetical protein WB561_15285 [Terracidiphilus sp.]